MKEKKYFGSCFLIHSATLYHLIEGFNLFTFKVIIEKVSFFTKWFWENWIFTCKKKKTGPFSYTTHKNQLQMD